jgi:serine/threonine protein kinase/tetratricopeptide (TPR) repeat protein
MTDTSARVAPHRLADFEILRRLGVGGMAEVFLAKKRGAEGTFKLLVVKRVLPQYGSSRRFRTMFAEEAQLATRLNHPNIVQVYDFQDYGDEGQLLSMEYVEGPDLRKLMRAAQAKGTRLPPFVSAFIIAEVAKGLHYAHERKDERGTPLDIVHRDVSPQNVLLSFEGNVKIADFGIASANLFREEPGVLKGKTGYMSPEQARGERVDRKSDIYSLGVVFHELLTGRPVHGAMEGADLLLAVREGNIEAPSTFAREVPPELELIAMRAVAKAPDQRFSSGRDLAAALTRALFHKQEVVDSHVLEHVITELVSREHTSPGVVHPTETAGESAPSRSAEASESAPDKQARAKAEGVSWPDEATGPGRQLPRLREQVGREVRHVAVVVLRIHGLAKLEQVLESQASIRFCGQLRDTLEDVAFKWGARWSWDPPESETGVLLGFSGAGRAVVGLLENPARAASDAAWLAVHVHDAVRGAADDIDVELEVSVGVVRGIATGQRDKAGHLIDHVLQEPANYLAEMLGEGAPAGVTWVAGGLYRLVRPDFVWGDAPAIEIDDPVARNLPRFIRIYSLQRPLTREEKAARQEEAARDLVGRDAELADLHATFHQAISPTPSGGLGLLTARVIYGEMGIGKTALVNTFLAELPRDTKVVRIECSPARSELPFGNLAEWLRELTGIRNDQPLEAAEHAIWSWLGESAQQAPHLSEVVTRLGELTTGRVSAAADEADLAHNQQLITQGIRHFLAYTAAEAPVVVTFDGLQWSDRPSLGLVSELARHPDPLPILLVLVTRPEDRVMPYINGLVRLELRGLSPENQIRLVATRLGADAGVAQVCADLLPRAGGNPFFLLEMVDALLERGTLELRELDDGSQELVRIERPAEPNEQLPSTLEQLIADRLNELPPEERTVVEWLAVTGGPLSALELQALAGDDGIDVEEATARLCARGLCDMRSDTVDVRYPLTRDVAFMALDPAVRARMHRKVGEYLRGTPLAKGLTAAIVARHLARGRARGAAAELYLEAAATARQSYQTQLATRYYRRALSLLEPEDLRRLDAHDALEAISRVQGRWRERRRHLIALRKLARLGRRPLWVARALLRTARFEMDQGRLAQALASAQSAELVARQAKAAAAEVQSQAMMAEILRDLGDMQGALAACDRALETASHPDVPARQRAEVLRTRGTLLQRVGRVHEAVDAHAEAIAVFRQAGARRQEASAKSSLAYTMFVLGRFEDAIALSLDAIRIDLSIGGRLQIAKTLSNIGQAYARLGDIERGLAYLKRAREAHERYGDQDSRADTLLCTAEVLLEKGDIEAADNLMRDAAALTAVSANAYDSVHEKLVRALVCRARGDSSGAVMHAFDGRQAAEARAYVAFTFQAMAIEAEARAEIGEHHTSILLATTALGAIETVQGSEYGLETRALCCQALRRAGSLQASEMVARAAAFIRKVADSIREKELRALFFGRSAVRSVLFAGTSGANGRS